MPIVSVLKKSRRGSRARRSAAKAMLPSTIPVPQLAKQQSVAGVAWRRASASRR